MIKLDRRLHAVAQPIRGPVHADVGSDHGYLLRYLLESQRVRRGIAIEKRSGPLENSRRSLAGLNADVRLADGLAGLAAGEVDSLSVSGIGGQTLVDILQAAPERVPDCLVLQPNSHHDLVRRWAREHGFQLIDETLVLGRPTVMAPQRYVILQLRRAPGEADSAYRELDLEVADCFGPWLIRKRDPALVEGLRAERDYLERLPRLAIATRRRLRLIRQALEALSAT
jgi:tRNA (adenine22-N1)-methyltransferase